MPKHSATERTGLPYDPVTASASISSPSPNPDTRVEAHVYALSDVGSTREHNEDTFLVADLESGMPVEFASAPREIRTSNHGLLFLVADGMGGAASGELASSMAGDVVLDALREHWVSSDTIKHDDFAEALRQATETANSRIHRFARENPEHRGMGTTATIAGLLGDWLFLAQVGDSRAYLIRNGQAQQLTKDQSLMQRLVEAGELTQDEADASERRNIILQALGPDANVTIDLTHQQIRRGDTLIICSDGLSGLVRSSEIADVAGMSQDVREICQRLVDCANERGGPDNITVIAVRFDGGALQESTSADAVGYTTFPLSGTLSDETREEQIPLSPFRSDPTPPFGTAMPVRSPLEEEFARARAAEQDALITPELRQYRKKRVAPIRFILFVIAAIVVVWLFFRYF